MKRWMAAAWCLGEDVSDVSLVEEDDVWKAVIAVVAGPAPEEKAELAGRGPTPLDALLDLAATLLEVSGLGDGLGAEEVRGAAEPSEDVAQRCGACGAEVG